MGTIQRRSFLRHVFLGAPLSAAFCGGSGSRRKGNFSPDFEAQLNGVPEEIKKELSKFEGPSSDLEALSRFLSQALNNEILAENFPLILTTIDDYDIRREAWKSSAMLRLLRMKEYAFLDVAPGRRLLVAYTNERSHEQSLVEMERLTGQIETFFPQVNRFFGSEPLIPWIHVNLVSRTVPSRTGGRNILIAYDQTESNGVITHEMIHLFNWQWTPPMPVFIEEGLTESVSSVLTDDSFYERMAPRAKVHLDFDKAGVTGQALIESVGGFLLFRDIIDEIGLPALSAATVSAIKTTPITADALLSEIVRAAPNPTKMQTLLQTWIADYAGPKLGPPDPKTPR